MMLSPIIQKTLAFLAVGFSFYGILHVESMRLRREIKAMIIAFLYLLAGFVATVADNHGFDAALNKAYVSAASTGIYALAFILFLAAIRPLMSMSREDVVSDHPKLALLFLIGVFLIALGPKGFLAP